MKRSRQSAHRVAAGRPQRRFRGRRAQFSALLCCAALAVAPAGLRRGHAQSAPASVAAQQQLPSTGNAEVDARRQQIARQCADLLKLATDLKVAVDKSTKDQLSVTVVRKADEIEQLARKVKAGSPKG